MTDILEHMGRYAEKPSRDNLSRVETACPLWENANYRLRQRQGSISHQSSLQLLKMHTTGCKLYSAGFPDA